MFSPGPAPFQQSPYSGNQPMNFHPNGYQPSEYHQQTVQEEIPFFIPLMNPQQSPPMSWQQQLAPLPQQAIPNPHVHFGHGSPIPRKQAWYHDENGKVDFNKIGSGVQGVMGIVSQIGPLIQSFNSIFK